MAGGGLAAPEAGSGVSSGVFREPAGDPGVVDLKGVFSRAGVGVRDGTWWWTNRAASGSKCLVRGFCSTGSATGDALAGAGRQGIRLAFQFSAAAANIGLNIALIPRYSWRGAAWASLATDGMLGICLWSVLLGMKHFRRGKDFATPAVPALI